MRSHYTVLWQSRSERGKAALYRQARCGIIPLISALEGHMHIVHLSLTNFRNYSHLELDLPTGVVVIQGDNAQGKTNLLEAIHYLSTMRSPRPGADRELVHWLAMEDDLPFARLVAQVEKAGEVDQIEVSLVQSGPTRPNANGPTLRKHIRVNGANKRVSETVGLLNAVLFMPQDLELVTGSPRMRRRYLDDTICRMDPRYCRALQEYGRVLTQRNYLLRSLRGQADESQLVFWDQRLVEHGAYLTWRRHEAIQHLDALVQDIHPQLTDGQERLRLQYCASVSLDYRPGGAYQMPLPTDPQATPEVDASLQAISASCHAQLQEARARELDQGISTVGPHRDDLRFLVNGVDMHAFGSRGQQRTITLSMKLSEVAWLKEAKNDEPVLLLDDVASELDASHRDCLLEAIQDAQQVLITTTELAHLDKGFLERATVWQVADGRIEGLTPQ
jgi:DNA replication and repair protein RecF